MAGQDRRKTQPAAALGGAWGDPAIIAQCGVGVPQDFSKSAALHGGRTASAGSCPTARSNDQSADVVMSTAGYRPVLQVTVPAALPARTASPPRWWSSAPVVKQYTRLVHPCH